VSVYRRAGSDIYRYDFELDGARYTGSTGATDIIEARAFERQVAADKQGIGITCRSVLRKAVSRASGSRRSSKGSVYMIKSGYFVKIGHSFDPKERIRSIQTATPDACELLFCIPGSQKLERSLHQEFAACHYQREWFFYCGKLKAFIDELTAERLQSIPHASPPNEEVNLASK